MSFRWNNLELVFIMKMITRKRNNYSGPRISNEKYCQLRALYVYGCIMWSTAKPTLCLVLACKYALNGGWNYEILSTLNKNNSLKSHEISCGWPIEIMNAYQIYFFLVICDTENCNLSRLCWCSIWIKNQNAKLNFSVLELIFHQI